MRAWIKLTLAALATATAVAGLAVVAYNQGAAANRVTPADATAYVNCMAYYHNADHCYQDVFASWQR